LEGEIVGEEQEEEEEENKEGALPNSSNIRTDIIRRGPHMIPSRLRQPSSIRKTHGIRQELIDALVETGVVDVELVLAWGVRGSET
jgi:hypothetical protein